MTDSQLSRPIFPKRAVITAGMPYGNKDLHFGHVGGLFVHADAFARFLRDRIGAQNVLFVSGTDCFGSPIVEYHRQAVESGEFTGTIKEFVAFNHQRQLDVLQSYNISTDTFAASGLGKWAEIHEEFCGNFLKQLNNNGHLKRLESSQFYDPEAKALLNGRQVVGRCPVPGCKSEKAYADECSLGHPYEPKELIAPKSNLTGQTPELKTVHNWYLDLEKFRGALEQWTNSIEQNPAHRPFVVSGIREFLEPPAIFLKQTDEDYAAFEKVAAQLPAFQQELSKNKAVKLVFKTLKERDAACQTLSESGVRFRAGKTLVPFRLTGNVAWGVPVPLLQQEGNDEAGLAATFWVWPESLWAPISFTAAELERRGEGKDAWKNWWASDTAKAYQFIGEDNLYFYSLAEVGMFLGSQGDSPKFPPPSGQLQTPELVVNNHILYLDKKASSSGSVKPPMARELLNHYTSDQLRAHFLALGLGVKSVGFKPKPLNPLANPQEGDPVLKEGNLLSNAFNKAVRTAIYTVHKYFLGVIPDGAVSTGIAADAWQAVLSFEKSMARMAFYEGMAVLDNYIRGINKHWTTACKTTAETTGEDIKQAVIDSFHMIRIATVLLHPIAPTGTELIAAHLNLPPTFFSWEHIGDPLSYFMSNPQTHSIAPLEARFDFFPKHPSQFEA